MNQISNVIHRTKNKTKYNILTMPTHERNAVHMSATCHEFYLYHNYGPNAITQNPVKTWDSRFAKPPKNHHLLDGSKGINQLPPHVDFDFILNQSKGGQTDISRHFRQVFGLPIITIEHTTAMPNWDRNYLLHLKEYSKSDINVFITDWSRKQWLFNEDESTVIEHGIDTELFCPSDSEKKRHVLTVANQFFAPEREWCLGSPIYKRIMAGIPALHLGDDPPQWKPAEDVNSLVKHYQECEVFLNTSTFSPIPTALLEAAACGCAIVTTATGAIPEIFTDEVNAFVSNDETTLKKRLLDLLDNPTLQQELGANARKLIMERFNLDRFVNDWNVVFDKAASIRV